VTLRESWRYTEGDPSIRLFDEAVRRWGMALRERARILELGCCETNFSEVLGHCRPDLSIVGVDVNIPNKYRGEFIHKAAESCEFYRDDFDAVIALGSIEHFGLGFYGDPINDTADIKTVALVEQWLKPNGWFYYDVPWTPEAFYVRENRHFRVYDDETIQTRLHSGLVPTQRGFATGDHEMWVETKPSEPMHPFWYSVELLEKVH
jgi:hypothetical protein